MFKGIEKINIKFVTYKLLPVALAIFLFASLAINFANNAGTGVIGKDEGVYIINAMGHYEHTSIDTPAGSWIDAIEKGMMRTNDPPGFFFLLHFWEYISFSEIWLRLLPYLFFVISIITLIRIGFLLKLPPFLSVVMGFIPLASAEMVFHAIEIRAYGMEICMAYLAMYYALKIIKAINEGTLIGKSAWIAFTLIMALGLSSRWPFVISSTAIYCVLFIIILLKVKREHLKKYFSSLMVSSFVSFLVFGIIFMMTFGDKLGVSLPFPSDKTIVFQKFGEFAMSGTFLQKMNYFLTEIFRTPLLYAGLCYWNFPSRINVILMCGARLIILIILCRVILNLMLTHTIRNLSKFNADNPIIKIKHDLCIYYGIFLITALVALLSMLLAYLGLHPFSIRGRHSLYLQVPFSIFFVSLIRIATYRIRNTSKTIDFISNRLAYTGLVLMLVFFALTYGSLYSSYNVIYRCGGAQHTPDVIRKVVSDDEIRNIDYWYISIGEANSFKYQVLYGKLKNRIPKKAAIIMEKFSLNNWNIYDNHNEIVNKQLSDIYKEAKPGSKIVMVTGHAGENEKVYVGNFFKYFNRLKKIGTFVQSSQNGEDSLGGEQAFFAVR